MVPSTQHRQFWGEDVATSNGVRDCVGTEEPVTVKLAPDRWIKTRPDGPTVALREKPMRTTGDTPIAVL
eukprot:9230940-Pyramimonas_sp.AAC.3